MQIKSYLIALLVGFFATQLSFASHVQSPTTTKTISSYAKTKYPLLFVHGMFGFSRLGTAEFGLDYWYQILPDLTKNGATAYAAQISPLESTEVRGEQLLNQVEEVLALTGQSKVNLIGHSHGGPTARYIAGVRPDLVASITSIAGVNFGSEVADLMQNIPLLGGTFALVADSLVAPVINYAQGTKLPTNFKASIYSLSSEGAAKFNAQFPLGLPTKYCGEGPAKAQGIALYSWTGTALTTNLLDPDTLLTSLGYVAFNGQKNDGLVSQCSSKFGKTIRDNYHHNHLDEVNQILGLRSIFSPDPVALYRQHANRLKLKGL